MRAVVSKLLLLVLPTATAVYGLPFLVLAAAGELASVDSVINRQVHSDRVVLYGPAYSNPVKIFKITSVIQRRPSVIVVGTSRVMQFRARMFNEPATFYNAGGAIATIWELGSLLDRIPAGHEPRVIVVGLDQYLFNPNFAEFRATTPAIESRWNDIVQSSPRSVYTDYLAGKFSLLRLLNRQDAAHRIGLNAVVNGNGFRNDGSYRYGTFLANPKNPAHEDAGFRDTFARIASGNQRFEYGRHVAPEAVDEVHRFLRRSRERDIYVVGLLPPFAHAVFVRMQEMGERYAYLDRLAPALKPIFESEGHGFFDFSDLATTGASDTETIDGFHASESAHVRMLLQMQQFDRVFGEGIAAPEALRARLATGEPFQIFRDEEF